jgi:hypothetical protein
MVGGSWMSPDGDFRQYGTSKAIPTTMGDYLSYGEWRDIEFTVTLSTLNATPAVQGNTTFLPSGVFIESVNVKTEVAATGASTLSIGTMRADRTTAISNIALVNVGLLANMDLAGEEVTYTALATPAGGGALLGTTTSFPDNFAYITATGTATPFTTGVVKVRIRYRGIGTITQ